MNVVILKSLKVALAFFSPSFWIGMNLIVMRNLRNLDIGDRFSSFKLIAFAALIVTIMKFPSSCALNNGDSFIKKLSKNQYPTKKMNKIN